MDPDKIRILKISKGSILVEFQVIEAVNAFNFDVKNKDKIQKAFLCLSDMIGLEIIEVKKKMPIL